MFGLVLYFLFVFLVVCFGYVLFFGAPYLPTKKRQSIVALDLLEIKQGQKFYELGCGDGRILIEAYHKGATVVGYELNPILYLVARFRTRKFRKRAKVKFGNFWKADLTEADAVYVFLLDKFMKKLDKKLSVELKTGSKMASYNFPIPDKKSDAERQAVFLYRY